MVMLDFLFANFPLRERAGKRWEGQNCRSSKTSHPPKRGAGLGVGIPVVLHGWVLANTSLSHARECRLVGQLSRVSQPCAQVPGSLAGGSRTLASLPRARARASSLGAGSELAPWHARVRVRVCACVRASRAAVRCLCARERRGEGGREGREAGREGGRREEEEEGWEGAAPPPHARASKEKKKKQTNSYPPLSVSLCCCGTLRAHTLLFPRPSVEDPRSTARGTTNGRKVL